MEIYVVTGYKFENGQWRRYKDEPVPDYATAKFFKDDGFWDCPLVELWAFDKGGFKLLDFRRYDSHLSYNHMTGDTLFRTTIVAGGRAFPMYRMHQVGAESAYKIKEHAGHPVTMSMVEEWNLKESRWDLLKKSGIKSKETKDMSFQVVWTTDKGVQTRSCPFDNLQFAIEAADSSMEANEEFVYINMGVMNDDGTFVNIAKRKRDFESQIRFVSVNEVRDCEFVLYWYANKQVTNNTTYTDYDEALNRLREWPREQAEFGWIMAIDDLGNRKLMAVRAAGSELIVYRGVAKPSPKVLEATDKVRIKKTTRDALLNILSMNMSDLFDDSAIGLGMSHDKRGELRQLMNLVDDLNGEFE